MNPLNRTHLTIVTWNSGSLYHKYHELDLFLNTYHVDILLATETKLTETRPIHISGYTTHTANHPSGNCRGGSAILIRSNLDHDALPPFCSEQIQLARIQTRFNGSMLQIGSFYSAGEYLLSQDMLNDTIQPWVQNSFLGVISTPSIRAGAQQSANLEATFYIMP